MEEDFDIYSIYEQNLNFLFGAGASYGFLPTLALEIKDADGKAHTFETLAKELDVQKRDKLYSLLFMYYYKKCISTGLPRVPRVPFPPHRIEVLNQYKQFLKTLLAILNKQSSSTKKANIYTTNYDGCFEVSSEDLMAECGMSFAVNDGSTGFQRRSFHTKNFNNRIIQKGIFDKHNEYLSQFNLLHPHGSVYWKKSSAGIEVDYGQTGYDIGFDEQTSDLIDKFEALVENNGKSYSDLLSLEEEIPETFDPEDFWIEYNKIPIVNPTKWKFHETVFEEAYYQILRHLSFELERPNTVLITFGFSFADEHILHLIQRSLSNPSLTLFISCFDENEKQVMLERFKNYKNVKYISVDGELDFKSFNEKVFALEKNGNES